MADQRTIRAEDLFAFAALMASIAVTARPKNFLGVAHVYPEVEDMIRRFVTEHPFREERDMDSDVVRDRMVGLEMFVLGHEGDVMDPKYDLRNEEYEGLALDLQKILEDSEQ